jgi:hypothetical protein
MLSVIKTGKKYISEIQQNYEKLSSQQIPSRKRKKIDKKNRITQISKLHQKLWVRSIRLSAQCMH